MHAPDMVNRTPDSDFSLEQFADAICHRGLRLPVLLALESGRPLAWIGGQLLWIAQPALSLLVAGSKIRWLAQTLEQPDAVETLIQLLELQKRQ